MADINTKKDYYALVATLTADMQAELMAEVDPFIDDNTTLFYGLKLKPTEIVIPENFIPVGTAVPVTGFSINAEPIVAGVLYYVWTNNMFIKAIPTTSDICFHPGRQAVALAYAAEQYRLNLTLIKDL